MPRPTVKSLVTEDLGYCCEWFFFTRFQRTSVIAARLGVNRRAVQYARARVEKGECNCEANPRCMKKVLKIARIKE